MRGKRLRYFHNDLRNLKYLDRIVNILSFDRKGTFTTTCVIWNTWTRLLIYFHTVSSVHLHQYLNIFVNRPESSVTRDARLSKSVKPDIPRKRARTKTSFVNWRARNSSCVELRRVLSRCNVSKSRRGARNRSKQSRTIVHERVPRGKISRDCGNVAWSISAGFDAAHREEEEESARRRQRIIFKRKCGLQKTVWNFIPGNLSPRAAETRLKRSHCSGVQTLRQLVSHVFARASSQLRAHFFFSFFFLGKEEGKRIDFEKRNECSLELLTVNFFARQGDS